MEQMGTAHKKEPRQQTGHTRGYSRHSSGSGKGGKPYVRQAFIAGLDDMEISYDDEPEQEDDEDDHEDPEDPSQEELFDDEVDDEQ